MHADKSPTYPPVPTHTTATTITTTTANTERSFCRDGTVSWFHGIRYLNRPPIGTLKEPGGALEVSEQPLGLLGRARCSPQHRQTV